MKLIKVNEAFFTVESLNYCICNSLDEVDSMSIYSPVQTATLGTVSSVDIIKLRIKKDAAEEAKKVFGEIEVICLEQLPEECAFITAEMTQGEFKEKLTKIESQVLAKIRVKD